MEHLLEPLKKVDNVNEKTGTEIIFKPSDRTFSSIKFDFQILEHRIRELAFLNSGKINLLMIDQKKNMRLSFTLKVVLKSM